MIARRGVARIEHIQIRTLFLQDLDKQGKFTVQSVGTKENTADLGTKPLSGSRMRLLMGWLGLLSEGKPVEEQQQRDHMESKQIKAMVQRVRCVGNFALAALFLGTGIVGSAGAKVMDDRRCSTVMSVSKHVMCSHVRWACQS